jgi:hypothetical protein
VSTAAAANPEGSGLTAWWAHHERWWWKAFLTVGVLGAAMQLVGWVHSILNGALTIAIILVVIMNISALQGHLTRLCSVCIDRMPADGQRIAEKRKGSLANYHRTETVTINLLALVPIIVLPQFFQSNNIYQAFVTVLIWGWFAYIAYLEYFHRPLVPFCPFCDWGGGDGPHEHAPDPDPSMIKTA